MAATGPYDNPLDTRDWDEHPAGELHARLEEEVCRAERQGTQLSCLLVSLDGERMHAEHGEQLPAQALAYAAAALTRQLRRFDRAGQVSAGELLVLLPGADGPRAEIVARRALVRLGAMKVELDGRRHPIGVAIGLGTWNAGLSAEQLLERTRLAAHRQAVRDAPAV
jgi:two-component system, sensor histidine kinase LadS